MKKIVCLFIFAFLPFIIFSQMRTTTSGHNGEIIALLNDPASKSDSFFCVGKDGFLSHWNNNQGNTYQLTDRQIKFAAIHPTKPEIAIYETDGNTENVVTVWDCQKLTKKFSVPFEDSILSLSYSTKGTYINIGTSTEAGTLFINSSNGNIEKPISEKMNMMSYVETTPSEKTFVSYSLTGNICYYYTDTKKQPKKIQTGTGFEPICTFANIRYIAGLKSGLVSIIDCVNGKTVFTQSASNACLFKVDDELYYFDQNSTKGGVINKIEFSESGLKSTPFEYIKFVNKDIITNIAKINDNLIFTSLNGDIYSAPFLKDETNTANLITYSNYQTINDGAFVNDTLYLLTNKSLFIVDELNGVKEILSNLDYTNMLCHNGNLILWNIDKNNGVFKYDISSNKITKLFVPQGQLLTVKSCAGQLIELESGTTVNRFDFEKNKLQEIYYGSGVQDAIMLSQTELFIAKSPTSSIDSSLVSVNTKTHETLPLKIDADFIYSVTDDEIELQKNPDNKNVYALGIKHNGKNSSTVLIKYNVEKKSTEKLYDFKHLSMHAYTCAYNENVYSNVIESNINSVNSNSKKYTAFARSSSLPKKVIVSKDNLIFVNQDGSISWLKPNSTSILYNWYITTDNLIVTEK